MEELNILGVDAGLRDCGLTLLQKRMHERPTVLGMRRVQQSRAKGLTSDADIARRVKGLLKEVDDLVPEEVTVHVVAVESYTPWNTSNAHGWKTAVIVGALMGWAHDHGAVLVLVNPSQPKKRWKATNKAQVAAALCGAIDGLEEALVEAGNSGHHASDSAGVAYEAMVKVFKQAREAR